MFQFKKSVLASLILTVFAIHGVTAPLWECDFDSWNDKGTRAYLKGTKERFFGATRREGDGFEKSAGVLVDSSHSSQMTYCPEVAKATEFTFEAKFCLHMPIDKKRGNTIVSIPKKEWGAGIFRLIITYDKCIEASFHTNLHKPKEDKKCILRTEPQDFELKRFYTIRVASKHDGPMKIWLDGKLIGELKEGAWGISDLPDTDTQKYYPLIVPGSDYSEFRKEVFRSLNGVIDDIKFWDTFEEISIADAAPVSLAAALQMPFFTNGNVFTTAQFRVKDRPGELLGTTDPPEERFVKSASHAEFSMDDRYFYAKIISPRAEGTQFNTAAGNVWQGDVVEFFLRPDVTKDEYFQYAMNANGSHEGLAYSAPMTAINGFVSKADFKNTVTADLWTAEFRIPREELKLAAVPEGAIIQLNAMRSGNNCGKESCWAPAFGNYHSLNSFNRAAVGTPRQAARRLYDAMVFRVNAVKKESPELSRLKKELQSVADILEKSTDTPELFFKVEAMLNVLDPQVLSQELGSMSSVIWRPAQPWGNNLKVSPATRKLEEISITMAQDSQAWYGFAFSNLTNKNYMGQLKLFTENRIKKNLAWQYYNAKIFGEDTPLYGRIELFEGLEVHSGTTDPIYDPLLPLPMNTLIRANAGQTVPLWLKVSSKGLKPGSYTGIFYLKGSNKGFQDQQIKLTVTVRGVDLKGIHVDSMMYEEQRRRNPNREILDFFCDEDINIIYRGCVGTWADDYPLTDKEGNIVAPAKYEQWDFLIDEYMKRGIEKKRIKILVWLELTRHGLRRNGVIPFPFNSEKWNKVFRQWILEFAAHFKEKYGFTDKQLLFYPVDEPFGDIDDPNSSIGSALIQAKIIKSANPNFVTFINPLPDFIKTFIDNKDLQAKLLPYFDIIEFYRPGVTPKVAAWARASGKEIWTYGIYCKTDSPDTYRREYWQTLRDDFYEVVTYWAMDDHSGCDGFCDFDGTRRTTDYGTCYCDTDYGKVIIGRRQVAHDIGREDYRIAKFCKRILKEKKSKALDAEFNAIIQEGVNGTPDELEKAALKLLDFAEKIARYRPLPGSPENQ